MNLLKKLILILLLCIPQKSFASNSSLLVSALRCVKDTLFICAGGATVITALDDALFQDKSTKSKIIRGLVGIGLFYGTTRYALNCKTIKEKFNISDDQVKKYSLISTATFVAALPLIKMGIRYSSASLEKVPSLKKLDFQQINDQLLTTHPTQATKAISSSIPRLVLNQDPLFRPTISTNITTSGPLEKAAYFLGNYALRKITPRNCIKVTSAFGAAVYGALCYQSIIHYKNTRQEFRSFPPNAPTPQLAINNIQRLNQSLLENQNNDTHASNIRMIIMNRNVVHETNLITDRTNIMDRMQQRKNDMLYYGVCASFLLYGAHTL